MNRQRSWRTRYGFYLIAIGSAFGLGNLWRFPYVVSENGGGAFVLLYVLMAFIVGAPLVIAELSLGKKTRQSVMKATRLMGERTRSPFQWTGRLTVLMSMVVLSYYSVIAGWVLHFIVQFFLGLFVGRENMNAGFGVLLTHGWLQWALTSVHILVTLIVVGKGVQEGLERWISSIMPLFAVLVGVLVYRALSLPSSGMMFRFLFYPDFSKLTYSSLNHAIGHVMFTLSVGFGTLVTFGSYFKEEDHVPTAGFRVALVDTFVSLIAALLIFPIALQASDRPMTDPSLLFETLPSFLLTLPGGVFFGLIFFVSLYLAALNSSIVLFETIVANIADMSGPQTTRSNAAWKSGLLILGLSLLPAFSSSLNAWLNISHRSLIELLDALLINWLLPLVSLGLVIAIRKGLGEADLSKDFVTENHHASAAMWPQWWLAIKWIIPALIFLGLALQLIGLVIK